MKRIFDLSHNEILALSDDQERIEKFISIELMLFGVSLASKPEEPSEIPQPDYKVWELCGLKFSNRDAANYVLTEIIANQMYLIKTDYDYRYSATFDAGQLKVDNYQFPEISEKKIYSQEVNKKHIQESIDRKKEYESALKEWSKSNASRDNAQRIVWDLINIHSAIDNIKHEHEKIYSVYLANADGNEEIAKRFFDKNEQRSFIIDGRNALTVISGEETPENFALESERIKSYLDEHPF